MEMVAGIVSRVKGLRFRCIARDLVEVDDRIGRTRRSNPVVQRDTRGLALFGVFVVSLIRSERSDVHGKPVSVSAADQLGNANDQFFGGSKLGRVVPLYVVGPFQND